MKFEENKGLSEQDSSRRAERIRINSIELQRRKEQGEIDPVDYGLNYLYYLALDGKPVGQSDVKRFARHLSGQAISITQEELETLENESGHNLQAVLANGEIITIDSRKTGYAKDDPLIIFPEELGEPPKVK